MRLCVALIVLCGIAAPAASPERSRVSPTLVAAMALRLDGRLARLMPDDPVMPIGLTQGTYITGYGAVFMGSVNLAPMAGITPFHQVISKEELGRVHQKKMDRMPKLKDLMQNILVDLASSMDPVPSTEQIAVAISLFYFNGEETAGLPAQIVMHAQRKALLESRANKALLASALRVEEF